jgi:pimeloyl-ACP methyl ester carboxylesterase
MKRILILLLLMIFPFVVFGDTRSFLEKEVRYWGIEKTISKADMDTLVSLKAKTEVAGLSQTDRVAAYRDLFSFVRKLRGAPDSPPVDRLAQMAGGWWNPESNTPQETPIAKPGEFGSVKKIGNGKTAMILIPDIGGDRTLFDSFGARNINQYTMFAVTLSGFGGTAPPARSDKLDFGTTRWWSNAEQSILNLIRTQKLDKPVLVGLQAGAYLAMKTALDHPDLVRGAVVLNGLIFGPLPGQKTNPGKEERVKIVNQWLPVELFPSPTKEQYLAYLNQGAGWICKDPQRQKAIVEITGSSNSRVWWNYYAELMSTDLSEQMKSSKVPMLVLPSIHDKESPGNSSSQMTVDQWNGFAKANPEAPIQITLMEDSRSYATEDQPEKLDHAIAAWVGKL